MTKPVTRWRGKPEPAESCFSPSTPGFTEGVTACDSPLNGSKDAALPLPEGGTPKLGLAGGWLGGGHSSLHALVAPPWERGL